MASNKINNMESKEVHVVIHPKKPYIRNNNYDACKNNHVFKHTCFQYKMSNS